MPWCSCSMASKAHKTDRTDYLTEQFILVREVVVDIPDTHACQHSYLAHGCFGIAIPLELLSGNRQYPTPYVLFQHLHL